MVSQSVIRCDQDKKKDLLLHLFEQHGWHQTLIFCRTKHGADALAKKLEQSGVKTAALHGNKTQGARTRALADFKSGRLAALVATDAVYVILRHMRQLKIHHARQRINVDATRCDIGRHQSRQTT